MGKESLLLQRYLKEHYNITTKINVEHDFDYFQISKLVPIT